ncbi:MAG: hypothetical protein ACI9LM_003483, partial [Alteromonadaceae bacterium]
HNNFTLGVFTQPVVLVSIEVMYFIHNIRRIYLTLMDKPDPKNRTFDVKAFWVKIMNQLL